MFSWFKRPDARADRQRGTALYQTVAQALDSDDDVGVRIIASVAALMLCVAYADSDYAPEEETIVAETLGRVQQLDTSGVQAILGVLRSHTVIITAPEATTYARELLELTDDDFRMQLFDALVDLAAADDVIAVSETNLMRTVTPALGLPQEAYNSSQARYRSKLAVLNG